MMGAAITGIGSEVLTIRGGKELVGADYAVMPDRIELGTIACAAAVTNGEVLLRHAHAGLLGAAGPAFVSAGVVLEDVEDGVIARRSPMGLTGIDIQTRPYPGFATTCNRRRWRCWRRPRGPARSRDDFRAAVRHAR